MIARNYEQEREDALAQQETAIQQTALKRAHELKMAELKLSVKPRSDKWRTLFKAPTYPVVAICIYLLARAGKPVPQSLSDFLSK